jgi:hypothetical protein
MTIQGRTDPPNLPVAGFQAGEVDAIAESLAQANVRAYVDEQVESALNRIMVRIMGGESADEVREMVYEEMLRGAAGEAKP